jgi:hypothetical protein
VPVSIPTTSVAFRPPAPFVSQRLCVPRLSFGRPMVPAWRRCASSSFAVGGDSCRESGIRSGSTRGWRGRTGLAVVMTRRAMIFPLSRLARASGRGRESTVCPISPYFPAARNLEAQLIAGSRATAEQRLWIYAGPRAAGRGVTSASARPLPHFGSRRPKGIPAWYACAFLGLGSRTSP